MGILYGSCEAGMNTIQLVPPKFEIMMEVNACIHQSTIFTSFTLKAVWALTHEAVCGCKLVTSRSIHTGVA